jgi:hypothetical protein
MIGTFTILDRKISERLNERDFDGRLSVDLFMHDPLLERLIKFHGESRADIYPGLTRGVKDHA